MPAPVPLPLPPEATRQGAAEDEASDSEMKAHGMTTAMQTRKLRFLAQTNAVMGRGWRKQAQRGRDQTHPPIRNEPPKWLEPKWLEPK